MFDVDATLKKLMEADATEPLDELTTTGNIATPEYPLMTDVETDDPEVIDKLKKSTVDSSQLERVKRTFKSRIREQQQCTCSDPECQDHSGQCTNTVDDGTVCVGCKDTEAYQESSQDSERDGYSESRVIPFRLKEDAVYDDGEEDNDEDETALLPDYSRNGVGGGDPGAGVSESFHPCKICHQPLNADGECDNPKCSMNGAGIQEDGEYKGKIEAYGVKGMKSTPWRKVFKNQAEFEKWLDKNEGDVEVHGSRHVEESRVDKVINRLLNEGTSLTESDDLSWSSREMKTVYYEASTPRGIYRIMPPGQAWSARFYPHTRTTIDEFYVGDYKSLDRAKQGCKKHFETSNYRG